jgi:hypothetical protein
MPTLPGPGSMQPWDFNPNALKNFRAASENNDPYAILGNRWHPDAVDMPINTGNLSGPKPLPAVNQTTLAGVVANQPQIPAGGYRPGQLPGVPPSPLTSGGSPTSPSIASPTLPPVATMSQPLPAQANPRARLASAVMGATGMQRPPQQFAPRPNQPFRGIRRPTFRNRFGPLSPRPFGG